MSVGPPQAARAGRVVAGDGGGGRQTCSYQLGGWATASYRCHMLRASFVLSFFLAVSGCDGSPPGTLHWLGYATRAGKIEWLFLDGFRTADDCDHAVRYHLATGPDSSVYRRPAGCVYASNSQWWSFLVNVVYQIAGYSQAGAMECLVARSTWREAEKMGTLYFPVVKGSSRESESYYCVM